jgi:signal transduction histidine kinase
MRILAKIFFLLCLPVFVTAQFQHRQLDSMHQVVQHAANDTIRMDACLKLGAYYDDVNLDSSVIYSEKGIVIAKQLRLNLNEAEMLTNMSWPLVKMGNYPRSLKVLSQALEIAGNPSNEKNTWHLLKGQTPRSYRIDLLGNVHAAFDYLYGYTGNYRKQITEAYEGIRLFESVNDTLLQAYTYTDIGNAYSKLNKLDSALYFEQKALISYSAIPFKERKYEGEAYSHIGEIHLQMGNIDLARENLEKAIRVSEQQNNPAKQGDAHLQLANLYQSLSKRDSCLFHARKALEAFNLVGKQKSKAAAYRKISDYYWDQDKPDSSFTYLRLATILNDSLDKIEKEKLREFQVEGFNEALRLQELEKEKIQTQSKIRTYVMLAGIGVSMLIAFLLYRNSRNRKKANILLQKQKGELQSTLSELRSTQSQLIQSEKMASLGELTAGIAHEIQNPLNFVNNFSEVNSELVDELQHELKAGKINDALAISNNIKDNEEKINHHGKRADAIVKGMLQHSRTSSGQKELTDINVLCDEYLRLSYHGLRAKDKSFNTDFKTDFDTGVEKIDIVPPDIGRVLLNLYNNAFFAVSEKVKLQAASLPAGPAGYKPQVIVRTRKLGDNVEIKVEDNGNGIPRNIVDKIFQPFFTTKPTGEGTGLGLSLSYDIIKAHGGEIKVHTKEGEGSEFIVQLPV